MQRENKDLDISDKIKIEFQEVLEKKRIENIPQVFNLFLKNLELHNIEIKNFEDWCYVTDQYFFINQLYSFRELVEKMIELTQIFTLSTPPINKTYYKLRRLLTLYRPEEFSINNIDNMFRFIKKWNITDYDKFLCHARLHWKIWKNDKYSWNDRYVVNRRM